MASGAKHHTGEAHFASLAALHTRLTAHDWRVSKQKQLQTSHSARLEHGETHNSIKGQAALGSLYQLLWLACNTCLADYAAVA